MNSNQKIIKTSEYLVAYLDFLGGETLIKNDKNYIALNDIRNIYNFVLENDFNIKNKRALKEIKFKIFSDNVVIASKLKMNTSLQIQYTIINFFYIVALFQLIAFNKGYLLRGGITVGDFYIDRTMIWGQALVEAYHLECEKAKFPRIILDDKVFEIVDSLLFKKEVKNKICMINDAGIKSLDYLRMFYDNDMKQELPKWRKNQITQIKKYKNKTDTNSLKILEKLDWQIDYFNTFCKKCNLNKYLINIKKI